jgi:tRNA threonylcarbamoyladenosine biosynthesis protein TsaE
MKPRKSPNLKMSGRQTKITEVLTNSPEETHQLGVRIALDLSAPGVLLLSGLLGTGKTTLTRGVAEGLGLKDISLVNSPSYTLINTYQGRCPIYHVDLYRLSGEREISSIGIEDFLGRDGVTVVEWSERLIFPLDSAIEIAIEDAGGDARRIRICYPALPGRVKRRAKQRGLPAGFRRSRRHEEHRRGPK